MLSVLIADSEAMDQIIKTLKEGLESPKFDRSLKTLDIVAKLTSPG